MANFPASLPSSTPADHGEVVGEIVALASALIGMPGRNFFRNGDFRIAQRGNGAFGPNIYNADGWILGSDGTGAQAATRGTLVSGQWPGAKNFLGCASSGQAGTAGNFAALTQRIEDVTSFAGKTVTVSFVASSASGTPKIGVNVRQNFGTGGSPSAIVAGSSPQVVTISPALARYSVTLTVPSITGKTLGTNGNDYLEVWFWLAAGTSFPEAGSIGVQANTWNFVDVQIEEGPAPTPFERLPQQVQLAWCQRYFTAVDGVGTGSYQRISTGGIVVGVNQVSAVFQLPVQMRAAPTVATSAVGNFCIYDGVALPVVTSTTVDTVSSSIATVNFFATAAGLTVGRVGYLIRNASASPASVTFTAEL